MSAWTEPTRAIELDAIERWARAIREQSVRVRRALLEEASARMAWEEASFMDNESYAQLEGAERNRKVAEMQEHQLLVEYFHAVEFARREAPGASPPVDLVHILTEGQTVCGFGYGRVPGDWPAGHRWASGDDATHATCPRCRAAFFGGDPS